MQRRSIRRLGIATAGIAAVAAVAAACTPVPVLPTTRTVTMEYTGATQDWTVPDGVREVTIDVYGAQGGPGIGFPCDAVPGGLGGHVRETFSVTRGQVLHAHVGSNGDTEDPLAPGRLAGANGGGAGSRPQESGVNESGGGGGASDVRIGADSLQDRIVVAGGGGGSGGNGPYFLEPDFTTPHCTGTMGGPGGEVGGAGASATFSIFTNDVEVTLRGGGGGGASTTPGAGGSGEFPGQLGGFGQGGGGADPDPSLGERVGGGGGGGYYGGGGGGATKCCDDHHYLQGGGGGGSSFASAPNHVGTPLFETGVQAGDGKVVFTYTQGLGEL